MRSKLATFIIIFFTTVSLMAVSSTTRDNITITGLVTDYKTDEPIIGVTITVKGTKSGATTDIDGKYSLTVPKNSELVFSYVGYQKQTIKVTEDQTLNVRLKENTTTLAESVVVDRRAKKDKIAEYTSSGASTSGISKMAEPKASPIRIEDMAVSYDMVSDAKSPRESKYSNTQGRGGLLTATEVNDLKKWDEWTALLNNEFSSYVNIWNIEPNKRFVARATDKNQKPIPNVLVTLCDASNNAIWTARTDNTGKAELWANCIYTNGKQQTTKTKAPYSVRFEYNNETKTINNAQPYPQETNVVAFSGKSTPSNNVDLFFTIDATGSMSDELRYIQTELYDIIQKIKQNQSNLNLRMGSLVYRDHGDDYVTKKSSLNSDINTTIKFLKEQSADGGGDYPEAVDVALYETIEKENWQNDALARIVFLILDAPAHEDSATLKRLQKQIELASKKGIRIVPLVASGIDKSGEYLMRSIALSTNGTYVTLTDDSGVGDSHIKPSTDYFKVEKLNDLIVRLVNDYTTVPSTIK